MSRRRFIAGAICPGCGAMDRLLVEATGGGKRRRCVACGYEDALDGAASPEPRTRLDRTAASDTAEPVRIVGGPPSKPDRSSD